MCGPGATGWASLLCPGCSTARRWPGSGCLRGRNLERSRERWWFFKAAGPVGPRVRREMVRSGILPQPLPKPAVGGAIRPWRCGSSGRRACVSWRSRVPSCAPTHVACAWWSVLSDHPETARVSARVQVRCPKLPPDEDCARASGRNFVLQCLVLAHVERVVGTAHGQ